MRNGSKRRCYLLNKPRKTTAQFNEEVKTLGNNEYELKSEYVKALIKVKSLHIVCGHIFESRPNDFLSGKRCPNCFGTPRKTNEEYRSEMFELVGDEYEPLEDYKTNKDKITVRHNTCGNEYKVTPYKFLLAGRRCPNCKHSKGEKRVAECLTELDVSFTTQTSFKGLIGVGGGRLKFDFAVLNNKAEITHLIEYDGELHYKSKDCFGGEEGLLKQQTHDSLKDSFCDKNNIPLIRIPYWKFGEIKEILKERISA